MIKKKRFRTGKGIFEGDYPSEAIIDEETSERYYDGIKPNYVSSKEICELLNELNELNEENERLKQQLNDKQIEWLRDNTVWEQMPTSKSTVIKTTLGDKND